jgi:hypothetical protein
MRAFQTIVLTFVGCFVCGVMFTVLVAAWSQPPTPVRVVWDPFVLGIIVTVAMISAIVVGPFAYYCLRGRRVLPCTLLTFAIVMVEILLTSPTAPEGIPVGILGAYVAFGFSLFYCRSSSHRWFVEHNMLEKG